MERIVDTNVQQEFAGTPLTHELLKSEGFRYKLDELSSEEADKHSDPFYYYKGEFRLYDVMDDFYVRPRGNESTMGARVQTLEALQEAYIDFIGRAYTKDVVLEDTAPPDYQAGAGKLKSGQIKIKLKGGPADGKTIVWRAEASFFIYQTTKKVGSRTITEGWNYQRKKDRKTIFEYAGPTPD